MLFPNLALWGAQQPDDAVGRIDRALNDRDHRLIAGLAIGDRFDKVSGVLAVSQGHGKYLRLRHVVGATEKIPQSIREGCLEFVSGENTNFGELSPLLCDLAEIQAAVVAKLQCEAGKYVDRVLAISVIDPGYWCTDFDGRVTYAPMCDSTTLAERSGVSVIDSFPARDLAVGGSGYGLDTLPFWLLFADRNPRVASQSRGLITIADHARYFQLPASDGLDSEVPEVRVHEAAGFQFLDEITTRYFQVEGKVSFMDQIYADGKFIPELAAQWSALVESTLGRSADAQLAGIHSVRTTWSQEITTTISTGLVEVAEKYLEDNSDLFSNLVRTGISWVLESVTHQIGRSVKSVDELVVSCPPQYEASVINHLDRLFPNITNSSIRKSGVEFDQLNAVVSAMLGLFHIDQMPANVPWITGAQSQRILGDLTPGRPSNWRQLLRTMADFQPAPMKLRDAV